jgi:hypothetical protein
VTKWAKVKVARVMAMAMRVAGDEGGNGDSSKTDDNGNKGGGQAMATVTKRVMVMATRVAGKRRQQQ